jgi:hypothetical protein
VGLEERYGCPVCWAVHTISMAKTCNPFVCLKPKNAETHGIEAGWCARIRSIPSSFSYSLINSMRERKLYPFVINKGPQSYALLLLTMILTCIGRGQQSRLHVARFLHPHHCLQNFGLPNRQSNQQNSTAPSPTSLIRGCRVVHQFDTSSVWYLRSGRPLVFTDFGYVR